MKRNITLSADEGSIDRGRQAAHGENRTLNDAFREWLEWYGSRRVTEEEVEALYDRLQYVKPGRKFTREEMNER